MKKEAGKNLQIRKRIVRLVKIVKTKRLTLIVIVISMALGALIAVSRGQDLNWDLLNYHYYNPYAYINSRLEYDYGPANAQTYFNPLIDLFSYFLINHFRPLIVGALLGAAQGLNWWLVFEIARRVLKNTFDRKKADALAILAAISSMFGTASLSAIGGTMADNLASLIVLSSLLLILISIDFEDRKLRYTTTVS